MKYMDAKKLHNGDEVVSKETGASLYVVEIVVDEVSKDVFVYCDDGAMYHHIKIK